MKFKPTVLLATFVVTMSLLLGAGAAQAQEQVTIGGTVSGLDDDELTSGLVLQNNGGDDLLIEFNGDFEFETPMTPGDQYEVTVFTQPEGQTCSVDINGGPAEVPPGGVPNVFVDCKKALDPVAIGGYVFGLVGSGLVLQNNGGDDLSIVGDGSFTFVTPLVPGADSYDVTIFTQPEGQTCSVVNPGGEVPPTDVTSVFVECGDELDPVVIAGAVFGLEVGSILLLQNDYSFEQDYLLITDNGDFQFNDALIPGTGSYNVDVLFIFPEQTCSVLNGSGPVPTENVLNVLVACGPAAEEPVNIGGTVTGLEGSGLLLKNKITDVINDFELIDADGDFTFDVPLQPGDTYNVTVVTNPTNPAQECFVARGRGFVPYEDVTNVAVTCAAPDEGEPPPDLDDVCNQGSCATDELLQEECEAFLAECLPSNPFNQDQCLGGAFLICAGERDPGDFEVIADAGPDLTLQVGGQKARPDGSQSTPESGACEWVLTDSPPDSNGSIERGSGDSCLTILQTDLEGTYTLELTYTFQGVSDTDTVVVTAGSDVQADAGPDQEVNTDITSEVFLNGSASSPYAEDPDRPGTFSWAFLELPPDSNAEINLPGSPSVSFVADEVGTYIVELTYTVGLYSDTDTVTVVVE